jgi:hypothetical protein
VKYHATAVIEVTCEWDFEATNEREAQFLAEAWDLREIGRVIGTRNEWTRDVGVTPVQEARI